MIIMTCKTMERSAARLRREGRKKRETKGASNEEIRGGRQQAGRRGARQVAGSKACTGSQGWHCVLFPTLEGTVPWIQGGKHSLGCLRLWSCPHPAQHLAVCVRLMLVQAGLGQ